MSTLQLLWFVLIGVLFSGFFFLEGFDFGVGMAVQTLAHNDDEKDQVVATIGPVWDGNEQRAAQCLPLSHIGMLHYLVATI